MFDMVNVTDNKMNNPIGKLLLFVVTLSILYLSLFILDPVFFIEQYSKLSISKILVDLILNVLFCFLIIEFSISVDRKMNKILPWTQNALKRLIVQTVIHIVGLFVVILLFSVVVYTTMTGIGFDINELSSKDLNLTHQFVMIFCITLMISTINTIQYLIEKWKSETLKLAEYEVKIAESKQLVAEAELHALRSQLDPHFVFNNLSVLSELISQDQQLGVEFTENFSRVYRYLLMNSKKTLIRLKEELDFLNAYLFLLEKRIGEGAIFEIEIPDTDKEKKIPPVTLQLLIENAVKYNRKERENPLMVKVFVNQNNELVVSNNLLPLLREPVSSGIGLKNITRRYALISDLQPQIEQTETTFSVKIPLIN